jgi:hypothetical protein
MTSFADVAGNLPLGAGESTDALAGIGDAPIDKITSRYAFIM